MPGSVRSHDGMEDVGVVRCRDLRDRATEAGGGCVWRSGCALHETFHCGDCGQFVVVDDVAAVGVEETVAVGVGVQIEPESPRSPEHVDVTVGETGVVEVDET